MGQGLKAAHGMWAPITLCLAATLTNHCHTWCALQAALYCLEDEEGPLLRYLANARDLLGRPLYDPQTALRLARQRNKLHACVELLCDLNLYEVSHLTCTLLSNAKPVA